MKQFTQPVVGKQASVTVRFPNIYYYSKEKWNYFTYTGTVGKNDKRVPDGSFLLLCQDAFMPARVIALRNVTELKYVDGTKAKKATVDEVVKVWQVNGSNGNVYTVTRDGNTMTCTCPGFTFRKKCRHTEEYASK